MKSWTWVSSACWRISAGSRGSASRCRASSMVIRVRVTSARWGASAARNCSGCRVIWSRCWASSAPGPSVPDIRAAVSPPTLSGCSGRRARGTSAVTALAWARSASWPECTIRWGRAQSTRVRSPIGIAFVARPESMALLPARVRAIWKTSGSACRIRRGVRRPIRDW
ncbi:hypothetical protein QLR68_08060 [Micromonospora sp. DH15]|nr:hypothetical protein [Micromonospora sp. DH15]